MTQALTGLLLDEPFFGFLAMRLELIEDEMVRTEATDGKSIRYNPTFIQSIPFAQVKAEICHEVMHCAKLHPYRRGTRDLKLWNVACDYVINAELRDAKYKLDSTWLFDPRVGGMSEEQVYTAIQGNTQEQQQRDIEKAQGHGEVVDGQSTPTEGIEEQRQNWTQAVLQAARQKMKAGRLPAFAAVLVDQITNPLVDWRAVLRQFVERTAKNDFSWTRPNRNYLNYGLYLPSVYSDALPAVVVYWDTSGSRWSKELRQLAANELVSIIDDARPERTYVIYADTMVQNVQVFERGDAIKLEPKGGGGTDFWCVFEYIEKEKIEPCCFIGVTDLDGIFPEAAPDYPVLWATDRPGTSAPFGETLVMKA